MIPWLGIWKMMTTDVRDVLKSSAAPAWLGENVNFMIVGPPCLGHCQLGLVIWAHRLSLLILVAIKCGLKYGMEFTDST